MRWVVNFDGRGPRRVNHAACVLDSMIYSFGGYSQELSLVSLKIPTPIDVHVLNTRTFLWTKRPVPNITEEQFKLTPYFRYGHTCVAYTPNGLIYLYGGRADWNENLSEQLHAYNPKNHKWSIVRSTNQNPDGRDGHTACVVNSSMYIFGGYVQKIQRFSNDVHEYNFDTKTWTTIVPQTSFKPHWRDFHTCTSIGDKFYVFGGRMDIGGATYTSESFYCNKLYEFDTKKLVWTEVVPNAASGEPPCGRRSHSAVAYKNKIIFFGGFDENALKHFNDVYLFDTVTLRWSRETHIAGEWPSIRRRHCCCVLNDRMFLFGGTGPDESNKTPSTSTAARIEALQNLYQNILNVINLNDNLNGVPVQQEFQNINNMWRHLPMIENGNANENLAPVIENEDEDVNANGNENNANEEELNQNDDEGNVVANGNGNFQNEFDEDSDDGEVDDEEDIDLNEFDRKLQSKCDLFVLDLEVSLLRDLCILEVLEHKTNYQNSNLPQNLKDELSYYSK